VPTGPSKAGAPRSIKQGSSATQDLGPPSLLEATPTIHAMITLTSLSAALLLAMIEISAFLVIRATLPTRRALDKSVRLRC